MEVTSNLQRRKIPDQYPFADVDSTNTRPNDDGGGTNQEEVNKKNDYMATFVKFYPMITFTLLVSGPYLYYFLTFQPIHSFGRVSEFVQGRNQILNCSTGYQLARQDYKECLPDQCQRYISDNIIRPLEAETLLKVAKKALIQRGPHGGASILNLYSGSKSSGRGFINVQDIKESDVFTEIDYMIFKNIIEKVKYGIGEIFKVDPQKLYLTHPSYFMEVFQWKAGQRIDNYWNLNFDSKTYEPFYYSATIFLNDYRNDFTGGRVMFGSGPNKMSLDPRKGRVLIFTIGPENNFYVETVDTGERYTLTLSFTCKKKYAIKDA